MVVSTVARINFRTDEKTKQDAEVLFNALGLDMSTALNMFLKQAVREQALPISPSLVTPVPNEPTLKAMNHANQIIDGKISEDGIRDYTLRLVGSEMCIRDRQCSPL